MACNDVMTYKLQLSRRMIGIYREEISSVWIRNSFHIIAQTNDQTVLLKHNYDREPTVVIQNFYLSPLTSILKTMPLKIA